MPVDHQYALLRCADGTVSIAACGSTESITISSRTFDEVSLAASISNANLPVSTVESHLVKAEDSKFKATLLAAYLRAAMPPREPVVVPTAYAVHSYQAAEGAEPEAKPCVEAFMQPIMDSAYAPLRSVANDEWSIDARLRKVATTTALDDEQFGYAKEFVKFFLGDAAHTLSPVDPEVVLEHQNRPTQVSILNTADVTGASPNSEGVVQSFQKSQAESLPAPGRNISTVAPTCKLQYSRYIYALAEVLKRTTWYAFCQNPKACAHRVATICENANDVAQTDLSKMDGTVSPALRDFEDFLLLHAFTDLTKAEAIRWAHTQRKRKCYTGQGVHYNSGTSRLSGSPETSAFNTIENALCVYCSFRAVGYAPLEAYQALGVYGGDDGITAHVIPDVLVHSFKLWGLTCKCEPTLRGGRVTFLARVYGPEVWNGNPNSCCDIPRQLGKFHTTVRHTDTPLEKLVEKLRAINLSDHNTPIFSELLEVASAFFDLSVRPHATYCMYTAITYPADVQYPNDLYGWYDQYVDEAVPYFNWRIYHTWLSSIRRATDFLVPFVCSQPALDNSKIDREVIVDGRTISPRIIQTTAKTAPPPAMVGALKGVKPNARARRSTARAQKRAAQT